MKRKLIKLKDIIFYIKVIPTTFIAFKKSRQKQKDMI